MMVNSQQMHMVFSHCVGVVASYLRVIAPAVSPNTDGFHISASTHVEIKNSIIGTGWLSSTSVHMFNVLNPSINENKNVTPSFPN